MAKLEIIKTKIDKKPYGAQVTFTFRDGSNLQLGFQYNDPEDPDKEPFWDYVYSRETFESLDSAVDDYVTYLTETEG